MKKILFLVLLPALLMGQALNTQSLTFTWPLNLPQIGMSAGQVGAVGAVPLYYWIVVRFPGGAIAGAGGPVTARNTVGVAALAPGTPVVVNWSPVAGATGYDIIRQDAGGTFQSTGACVNCVVALNTALLTVSDQNPVGPGGNWPPAGLVTLRSHSLTMGLDGVSEAAPYMALTLDGVPGRLPITVAGVTPMVGILSLTAPPGGSAGVNIYGPVTQSVPLIDMHADANAEFRIGAHGAGVSITENMRMSRGTFAAPVVVQINDTIKSLVWQGYDGATYQPAASIVAAVDAAPGAGDMPGSLSFRTTPDAAAAPVERIHIDNAGVTTALFEVQVSSVAGGYLDWSTHPGTVRAVRSLVSSTFTGGGPTTSLYGGDFRARSLVGAAPGIIIGTHGYADTGAGTVGTDVLYGVHGEAAASVGIVGGASGVRGDMLISGAATMAGPAQSAFGVKGYFDDALGLSIATNYTAAIVGWITDRNTAGPTGAVIAYLDGGGVRTAPNNPTSAFRVVDANAAAGVGFQYGLDLYWNNGAGFATVLEAADIRGQNQATLANPLANTWRIQDNAAAYFQQDVYSAAVAATAPSHEIRKSRGTSAAPVIVVTGDTLGNIVFAGWDGAAFQPAATIVAGVDGVPGAGDMPGNIVFSTSLDATIAPVERLRISNAGVITATTRLVTQTQDAAADARVEVHNDVPAAYGTRTIRRSRGTLAAPTIVVNADTVGGLVFEAANNNAAATYLPAASIIAEIDAAVAGGGAADMPGRLIFSTTPDAAGAVVERLRIDNAGYITATTVQALIQANAASELQLAVHSVAAATTSPTHRIRRSRGVIGTPLIINNADTIGSVIFEGYDGAAWFPTASIVSGVDGAPAANDMPGNLVFSTTVDGALAVTERLRISNAGVITAASTQTIVTADLAADVRLEVHNAGAAVSGTSTIRRSRGTLVAETIVVTGDTIGSLIFAGNNGVAGTYLPAASIVAGVDNVPGAADMPGNLVFSTTLDGEAVVTERMRINNAGNIGIGTAPTAGRLSIAGTPGNVSYWTKYALVSIANGVNGCANATGCWQVNGVLGAIRAAALTQDVVLFQLPAKGYVERASLKTAVVCDGTTTALSGLGLASNNIFYRALTYDIAAGVADGNLSDAAPAGGRLTAAAENVVASLLTTAGAQFVDTLAAGCAIDYWVKWAVLP